jgi:hypothetical protein
VSKLALGLGLLGSAALGAGAYGLWLAPEVVAGSAALLFGGLLALSAALLLSPRATPPVRVGALGVMLGEPPEAQRVPWCEIQNVRVVGEELRLETKDGALPVPLVAHARAAARILAEAAQRIGARVDVSPRAHERLPPLTDDHAELVPLVRLQLAGRKCTASGTSITFESDARLCENCAALYHVSHAPLSCLRCERPLQAARQGAAAYGQGLGEGPRRAS